MAAQSFVCIALCAQSHCLLPEGGAAVVVGDGDVRERRCGLPVLVGRLHPNCKAPSLLVAWGVLQRRREGGEESPEGRRRVGRVEDR